MTTAVRHCVEGRFQRFDSSAAAKPAATAQAKTPMKDPIESILELTYLLNTSKETDENETMENLLSSFIKTPGSVLQDIDIHRLRAIIYRDVVRQDRSKTGKNVVVVVVISAIFSFFFCFMCFVLHDFSFTHRSPIDQLYYLSLKYRMIRNKRNF